MEQQKKKQISFAPQGFIAFGQFVLGLHTRCKNFVLIKWLSKMANFLLPQHGAMTTAPKLHVDALRLGWLDNEHSSYSMFQYHHYFCDKLNTNRHWLLYTNLITTNVYIAVDAAIACIFALVVEMVMVMTTCQKMSSLSFPACFPGSGSVVIWCFFLPRGHRRPRPQVPGLWPSYPLWPHQQV